MIINTALSFALTLILAASAFACQVDTEEINSCIAGVGYYQPHIDEQQFVDFINGRGAPFTVTNNVRTSIPTTLWFHVKKRVSHIEGDTNEPKIVVAKLYYKIIPNGQADDNASSLWRLAKSVDTHGAAMTMNYDTLVKLFGNMSLTMNIIKMNGDTISKDDAIIFVWYVEYEDGLKSGREPTRNSNFPAFNVTASSDLINVAYTGVLTTPAFVFKIIYNGLTTP